MEHILLGLLFSKKMNIYELKSYIKKNLSNICSDSTGSIQVAIKKLLGLKEIDYEEYVEKGINKKAYFITEAGRKHLFQWLGEPINPQKAKNMELGKLFFMGIMPLENRQEQIQSVIIELEKELQGLEAIYDGVHHREQVDQSYELIKAEQNPQGLQAEGEHLEERVKQIYTYQMLTLQYGMAEKRFQIQWLQDIQKQLRGEIDEFKSRTDQEIRKGI